MKVLLVAATSFETELIRAELGLESGRMKEICDLDGNSLNISLLQTGIGMVNTAYQLGRMFAESLPDLALQIGIGGAFAGGPEIGAVVEVVEEIYPELGADSPTGFLDLSEMGFAHFEVKDTVYGNSIPQPRPGLPGFQHCRGVTVNRVSGEADAIAQMVARWAPAVESMEGAAFFQACLLAKVPFRQLRAISNRVEPRNKAGWKMAQAIQNLNITVLDLLNKSSQNQIVL